MPCLFTSTCMHVQQSPDNHTMLNHTTLLFAPNLSRIKWNVTKFALIITQKPLIIAQFYISFLHLQLLFVSFVALWVVCGLLKTPEINISRRLCILTARWGVTIGVATGNPSKRYCYLRRWPLAILNFVPNSSAIVIGHTSVLLTSTRQNGN